MGERRIFICDRCEKEGADLGLYTLGLVLGSQDKPAYKGGLCEECRDEGVERFKIFVMPIGDRLRMLNSAITNLGAGQRVQAFRDAHVDPQLYKIERDRPEVIAINVASWALETNKEADVIIACQKWRNR